MENYVIYFEIFGKKLKVTILAENEVAAKQAVLDKVKFHKVVAKRDFKGGDDFITDFLNGFKPKK